jgi:hypothetical protein
MPTNLEAATDQEPATEPTQADIDAANAALNSVVGLKARKMIAEAAERGGVTRDANGLVMVRAKPEKRKNVQQRSKERNEQYYAESKKDRMEAASPVAGIAEVAGLSTAHPKPEKRKNAKERAKEKYAKVDTKDRTTPDMTATAKSKVLAKAIKGKPTSAKAA